MAYLVGSIPTGFLVARSRGVDIRSSGSGNIGATNTVRVLGRGWGVMVLLADFAKGLIACLVIPLAVGALLDLPEPNEGAVSLGLLAAVFVVFGHNFPVWLRFKGGKGIATSAGILAALLPWALVAGLSAWFIFLVITRYVSVASIASALAIPIGTWFSTSGDYISTVAISILSVMAICKHGPNIRRLFAGTESRLTMGRKSKGSHS